MKKIFSFKNRVLTFTAFTLVLTLCSCSGSKVRKDGSRVDTDSEIRIRVWESENGPDDFIRAAGKEYNKLHPNVYIDFIYMKSDTVFTAVLEDAEKGVLPDIFSCAHDRLGELVESGVVLPTVDPDYVKKTVLGACSKALIYKDVMYGYPMSAETYALYYNKAYIKESEVPKTFEDLVKWSQNFMKENPGKYGFVMDLNNAYYGIIFLSKNNNRLFGESGLESSNPNVSTKSAIEGVKYFQYLRSALGLENVDLGSCDGLFTSGATAMHVTGPWNLNNFEKSGVDFGVAPLPSLPGESTPAASFSGTRGMYVCSTSKHPDVAADFAKFLLTPEMQKLRFEYTTSMPSVDVEVNSKYISGFLKQLDYAFPMPSIPEMSNFWNYMGGSLYAIWNGADVESELKSANEKIKKK